MRTTLPRALIFFPANSLATRSIPDRIRAAFGDYFRDIKDSSALKLCPVPVRASRPLTADNYYMFEIVVIEGNRPKRVSFSQKLPAASTP
jgi:hypothetical protein